jgi:hypothetical protein
MGEGEGGGENILTPPTLILPRKGGGDFLSRFAMNSKGISVLFLVIAMLLMITIGYVLSYLIPTKQKSVKFPIYSNQAFFIAQSGVEFAIRYASDQGWRGTTDSGVFDLNRLNSMSRPLGNGTFTISYNNAIGDILTSTGQITGSSENRIVKVSNFTQFLRLIFDPASPAPCRNPSDAPHTPTNRWARFYVKNVRSDSLTLNRFSATWTGGDNLAEIYLGGTLRYSGSVSSPTGIRNFISNQQINSNQIVSVFIYWDKKIDTFSNIIITFYTTGGEGYIFNLDSAGNGLPTC